MESAFHLLDPRVDLQNKEPTIRPTDVKCRRNRHHALTQPMRLKHSLFVGNTNGASML